jgi:5-(carboxyamino)imidazole ribonucleotide synthase
MILPGATLGILGGGQLGRMFAMAARTMGYGVIVLDPDQDSPAAQLANGHICASYTNSLALDSLARECAAITTEFENVPAESLEYLSGLCPVRPSGGAVAVVQDRIREKRFLQGNGFETARFAVVEQRNTLWEALKHVGTPALIKLSRSGYDGKGQRLVRNLGEAQLAFDDLGAKPCVMEQWIDIQTEVSVVIARGDDASTVAYPPSENWHRDGILDVSVAPARILPMTADAATRIALQIAAFLGYCGVITVEFFVLKDGSLLVNEIAPRPHNSGHYTLDACLTSQFEQQVRALCGLPLGGTTQFCPAVMVNLLGDLWHEGREPAWEHVLCNPRAKLHLYGKFEARPGRKMGHYTCLAPSVEDALSRALKIRTLIGADRLLDPVGFGCAVSGDEPHDPRCRIKRGS